MASAASIRTTSLYWRSIFQEAEGVRIFQTFFGVKVFHTCSDSCIVWFRILESSEGDLKNVEISFPDTKVCSPCTVPYYNTGLMRLGRRISLIRMYNSIIVHFLVKYKCHLLPPSSSCHNLPLLELGSKIENGWVPWKVDAFIFLRHRKNILLPCCIRTSVVDGKLNPIGLYWYCNSEWCPIWCWRFGYFRLYRDERLLFDSLQLSLVLIRC